MLEANVVLYVVLFVVLSPGSEEVNSDPFREDLTNSTEEKLVLCQEISNMNVHPHAPK